MNNWSIRNQIILLMSLPALFVWIAMTASTLYTSWNTLTESQQRHGDILAKLIAPSTEFAIFSGNIAPLKKALQQSITDSDIEIIEIYDTEFHLLHRSGNFSRSTLIVNDTPSLTFTAPVYSTITAIEDNIPPISTAAEQIGSIAITLSTQPTLEAQQTIIRQALWLGFLSLTLIGIVVLLLTNRVTLLFKTFRGAMHQIALGDYSPPKQPLPSNGELGELSQDLHKMAAALERNRRSTLAAYEQLELRAVEAERIVKEQH